MQRTGARSSRSGTAKRSKGDRPPADLDDAARDVNRAVGFDGEAQSARPSHRFSLVDRQMLPVERRSPPGSRRGSRMRSRCPDPRSPFPASERRSARARGRLHARIGRPLHGARCRRARAGLPARVPHGAPRRTTRAAPATARCPCPPTSVRTMRADRRAAGPASPRVARAMPMAADGVARWR